MKYQRHSDTSRDAAEQALVWAPTARLRVLALINYCGRRGATDEEVQLQLDMNPSTQRPRRVELWEAGYVRDSGKRRNTVSGVAAVVWMATARGKIHLALKRKTRKNVRRKNP